MQGTAHTRTRLPRSARFRASTSATAVSSQARRSTARWTMQTLDAETLTDARRERDSWLAGLREGRIASPSATTFAAVFSDWQASRRISERTRKHERHLAEKRLGSLARRAASRTSRSTEIATAPPRAARTLRRPLLPPDVSAPRRRRSRTRSVAASSPATRSTACAVRAADAASERERSPSRRRDGRPPRRRRRDAALADRARPRRIRGPAAR